MMVDLSDDCSGRDWMNGVGQDTELDRSLDFRLSREDTMKTFDVLVRKNQVV
jgi:hypothetical protein